MGSIAVKLCSRCKAEKPIDEFTVDKRKASGHTQPCLECGRISSRANSRRYRERHREELRVRRKEENRRYRESHKEQIAAGKKRCYQAKPEQYSRMLGSYRLRNAEKRRASTRQWRLSNPERARESNHEYYIKNSNRISERVKKWRDNNLARSNETKRRCYEKKPELYRALGRIQEQRRRAKKLNCAVNDFTKEQWELLKEQYGGRCAYCGKMPNRLEQDHVVPLARGGNHTCSNIVPACTRCNRKKGSKTLEEIGMRFAIRVPI